MQWTDVVEAFLTAILLSSFILGAAYLFSVDERAERAEDEAARKQVGD